MPAIFTENYPKNDPIYIYKMLRESTRAVVGLIQE